MIQQFAPYEETFDEAYNSELAEAFCIDELPDTIALRVRLWCRVAVRHYLPAVSPAVCAVRGHREAWTEDASSPESGPTAEDAPECYCDRCGVHLS